MTDRRLVILGPAAPYRGGIAQHTDALCQQLRRDGNDVLVLSFSRLYPRWLFPGASDKEPGTKEVKQSDVEYIVDSVEPLSWLRTVRRIQEFEPTLVLIPWWTFFLAPCLGTIARLIKRHGYQVAFLCHNVLDHESSAWKNALAYWTLRVGNGFVAQTSAARNALETRFPGRPVIMHLHPVYDRFPEFAPKLTRRATCELLFFGFIRQYKGLDLLIRAIAQLDSRDIFLTIAGECWTDPDRYRHLAEQLGVADRVEFQLRYHSDTEAASLFQRADLVILPYRSASGTGIIPVAYHYGKPIVATNVGGIPDAVLDECTGILVPPEDPQSLAVAIRRACGGQIWGNLEEGLRKMRERMSWEGLSRSLIDLHDILSAPPDRQ